MLHMPSPMFLANPAPSGGQAVYLSSGPFAVPAGVTSISAVGIGAGGLALVDYDENAVASGSGATLAYQVAIPVTPGETLSIEAGSAARTVSRILRGSTVLLTTEGAGGSGQVRFTGGAGVAASIGSKACAGAGAGGYAGDASQDDRNTMAGGGGTSLLGGTGGGASGGANTGNTAGLAYGGGEGIAANGSRSPGSTNGPGAVRIIWGVGRAYPNTNTGDV